MTTGSLPKYLKYFTTRLLSLTGAIYPKLCEIESNAIQETVSRNTLDDKSMDADECLITCPLVRNATQKI